MSSPQPKFHITILPSLYAASAVLCLALALIGTFALRLPFGEGVLFGIGGLLIHWASGLVHHLGHILAARNTGYPISGLRLGTWGGLLGTDVYPENEPPLSPRIHVRRALGGPVASLLLTVAFGVLAYVLSQNATANSVGYWLVGFGFLINLLLYFAQASLPLGFNDGTAVWRYLVGKLA